MAIKRFTLMVGILFAGIGLMGFFPQFRSLPWVEDPALTIGAAHGRLFGLFPVNAVHNLLHLALGFWGIAAANDMSAARLFCRANAVIYAVLAVAGLFPYLNTIFGLVPLHGHDVWLHALIAGATGYFGYVWEPGIDTDRQRTVSPGAQQRPHFKH